jgi:hypothetical protein
MSVSNLIFTRSITAELGGGFPGLVVCAFGVKDAVKVPKDIVVNLAKTVSDVPNTRQGYLLPRRPDAESVRWTT